MRRLTACTVGVRDVWINVVFSTYDAGWRILAVDTVQSTYVPTVNVAFSSKARGIKYATGIAEDRGWRCYEKLELSQDSRVKSVAEDNRMKVPVRQKRRHGARKRKY